MARAARKSHQDDENDSDEGESPRAKGKNVVPFKELNKDEVQEKVRNAVEELEDANNSVDAARTQKSVAMKKAVDMGLDRKILNKIIKLRKSGDSEKENEAELTKLYAEAVGLQLAFAF